MRVLIVDDDVSIVVALQMLLERDGHEVITCTNPLNAAREEAPFDVVISDFNMPSIDGVQLLERLRETHPRARRFLMTAYDRNDAITRAERSGLVEQVFAKPWRIETIRAALR